MKNYYCDNGKDSVTENIDDVKDKVYVWFDESGKCHVKIPEKIKECVNE